MGLVFDPERVGEGNIPASIDGQAQYDAAALLGESLAELTSGPNELLAYMVYGSAATPYRGLATRRSDVDLLVITDGEHGSVLSPDIAARIEAVGAAYDVDICPTVYNRTDLGEDSRVNPFYSSHLSHIRGMAYHGTDQYFSADFLTDDHMRRALFDDVPFVDAWPFAIEYLKARRSKFQEELDQFEPDLMALKGPFEVPRNIGRTIGDLFDAYVIEHTDAYDTVTDEIIGAEDWELPYWQKLLKITDTTGMSGALGEDIERLHELDTTYSVLLEDTVAGHVSVAMYEAWLRSVYVESLERAFKVSDLADTIVLRTVEMAQLDPTYDKVKFDEQFLIGWYPEGSMRELEEMIHRSQQIKPVSYDAERLLFRIAPKHPDIARRYAQRQQHRRQSRQQSDQQIISEWRAQKSNTTGEA